MPARRRRSAGTGARSKQMPGPGAARPLEHLDASERAEELAGIVDEAVHREDAIAARVARLQQGPFDPGHALGRHSREAPRWSARVARRSRSSALPLDALSLSVSAGTPACGVSRRGGRSRLRRQRSTSSSLAGHHASGTQSPAKRAPPRPAASCRGGAPAPRSEASTGGRGRRARPDWPPGARRARRWSDRGRVRETASRSPAATEAPSRARRGRDSEPRGRRDGTSGPGRFAHRWRALRPHPGTRGPGRPRAFPTRSHPRAGRVRAQSQATRPRGSGSPAWMMQRDTRRSRRTLVLRSPAHPPKSSPQPVDSARPEHSPCRAPDESSDPRQVNGGRVSDRNLDQRDLTGADGVTEHALGVTVAPHVARAHGGGEGGEVGVEEVDVRGVAVASELLESDAVQRCRPRTRPP